MNDSERLARLESIKNAAFIAEIINEYIAARDAFEYATRKPNSHAQPVQLKHGNPIALRYRAARHEFDLMFKTNDHA